MKPFAFLVLLCAMLCSCNFTSQKTLYIFTWSHFFDPDLIKDFERENNCKVVLDMFDSNESMYAKLKFGAARYDLIVPSNYYLDILQQQKIIENLDQTRLSGIDNLDPKYFKEKRVLAGIPLIVSFSGIAYRSDRLPDLENSWGVFSQGDLRGRMTMLNDLREALGAALRYLGYSINTKDPEHLQQAADVLIQWKQNLAKFESEQYKNGLVSGEFLVCQAFSIDVMQIRNEDKHVQFIFPKEGAILSIDYLAIPRNAGNKDLAYQFINFILRPENAAKNMNFNSALIPVKEAYPLLNEQLKNSPILFPPQEVFDKMELIKDVGEEIKLYYRTWEVVKIN